jgi:two-component system phosphate regulon sensor histidine kinase PhoR
MTAADKLELAQAELAREQDRLSALLQSTREGLIMVDAQRRVTLVNASAMALLELPQDIVGRPLLDVVQVPALVELVSAAQGGLAMSTEFETSGSITRQIVGHANSHESAGGAVLVLDDVSEIRRLETIRRDFIANVSHELRTPVSIIRANAETLLDGAMDHPDQAQRFLKAMLRSSDRLGRLVGDLLDISRIEAGKYPIELLEFRLAPLMARVIESVEPKAADTHTSVSLQVAEDTIVSADAKALEQVLVNLVDNAIKYTPTGGHVWARATASDGDVLIEIADDGPGIGAAHRARVFERFFRVDPGRSRDMGGTGLGLSIVKHLTDAMGGTVGVEPRDPCGAVFWVRLANTAS